MPEPLFSLNWKETKWQQGVMGLLVFEVTGVASKAAAVAACPCGAGATFPEDDSLTADDPTVSTPRGLDLYRVEFNFKPGDSPTGGEPDPLKQPPLIQWTPGNSNEAIARDAHGNPYLNAAGQQFSQFPTADILELTLTITRNERTFPLGKALKYSNGTNNADWTILNLWKVEKGQAKCFPITQAGQFPLHSRYVTVNYVIGLRGDGWKQRLLNQGAGGWRIDTAGGGNKPIPGPFWFKGTQQLAGDIPLRQDGTPVLRDNYTVAGSVPVPAPIQIPKTVEVEESADGSCFLKFDPPPGPVDFNGLLK
jgi:hypothetical protein